MKSGKSWRTYSKLQVTREWMTVNLHVLLKIYSAAYHWKLQVIPMVPRFAVSRTNDVCSFVWRDRLEWMTADISCMIHIKRKFFEGKVVWWCLSQHIAGISHERQATYEDIMYDERYYSDWNDGQNADFALFELIKRTNLDIKDSACLHVVRKLQHPTSRPTTRSTYKMMIKAPKTNLSPLPARKYGKSTKKSPYLCHQANEENSGL